MPPVAAVWSLLPLLLLAALGSAPVAGDITVTLGQYSCSGGGEATIDRNICVSMKCGVREHLDVPTSEDRRHTGDGMQWCGALCGAAPRDITDSIGTEIGRGEIWSRNCETRFKGQRPIKKHVPGILMKYNKYNILISKSKAQVKVGHHFVTIHSFAWCLIKHRCIQTAVYGIGDGALE